VPLLGSFAALGGGLLADVHRRHLLRAARQLQREGAAVGEAIQGAAARVASRLDAVLRLIEKGAGLLALEEIGDEADFALGELHRSRRRASQHAFALREPFVRAHLHVVALDDGAGPQRFLQQRGEKLAPRVGGLDQRLHREAVGVAIDHQPGQQIGLAVHDSAGATAPRVGLDRIAEGDGPANAAGEELFVDGLVLSREQADGDLALRSVERLPHEPAALVGQPHHLAAR